MDYRIRSGDTMSGIAVKFNVSLAALETANPQIANPSMIHLNELLNVPAPAPVAVPVPLTCTLPVPASIDFARALDSGVR